MSKDKILLVLVLMVMVAVTGCAKKVVDDPLRSGAGFDTLSTSDDLSQLPQAPTSDKQTAVEPLPIEAAPVTQAVAAVTAAVVEPGAIASAAMGKLSRDQKIQQALKTAGFYNGNIDGKIGPASKQAIEEFQKSHGLKADGKVGPKTMAALESVLNGQAVTTEVPVAEKTGTAQ